MSRHIAIILLCTVISFATGEETPVDIQGPQRGDDGIEIWTITSPYTMGANTVRVLLPDGFDAAHPRGVLYVLPVGGEPDGDHGDGLREVRAADAHNRHDLICVTMAFGSVPWYGSHETDPAIRHDEYLLKVVLPLIESRYGASTKAVDRLLFGFSKSGFGAVSLLLRNPDVFGAACSWDAPLTFVEKDYGKVGTRKHFGSAEQMAKYQPMSLIDQRVDLLKTGPNRLTILGSDVWKRETEGFHHHLDELGIPHRFDGTLAFKHHWASGWVPNALAIFLADRDQGDGIRE